jgi:phenylpyruvate tautomerase PptA (4-oxalocrotonate tautomerase family)
MPITVTAPPNVLTDTGVREIVPRLTAALAEAFGAPGDPALIAMIGGHLHLMAAEHIYAGGVPHPLVVVELKLPAPGLGTLESRAAFITAATDIVDALTVDGHDRADTWVNILNAPDGGWGLGGRAYTNEMLAPAGV